MPSSNLLNNRIIYRGPYRNDTTDELIYSTKGKNINGKKITVYGKIKKYSKVKN
ncbi:MAG: hypothetical protein ACTSUG_17955 [Candidatus Helarchaeota archaeon]